MRLDIVLVDHLEENVHDLMLDVYSQGHKLAVDAVQNRLQVVALTRIFTIKELKEATYKVMRHMLHDHILTKMNGKDKLKEQKLKSSSIFLEYKKKNQAEVESINEKHKSAIEKYKQRYAEVVKHHMAKVSKEKEAFEKLIGEKKNMVIPEHRLASKLLKRSD